MDMLTSSLVFHCGAKMQQRRPTKAALATSAAAASRKPGAGHRMSTTGAHQDFGGTDARKQCREVGAVIATQNEQIPWPHSLFHWQTSYSRRSRIRTTGSAAT